MAGYESRHRRSIRGIPEPASCSHFSNADLALDQAALKGDVALVAVGDDFFDTITGACRQNMTENGHKRHEHQTFLSPAVDTCKTDASRGDGRGLRPRRRHDCAPEVLARTYS